MRLDFKAGRGINFERRLSDGWLNQAVRPTNAHGTKVHNVLFVENCSVSKWQKRCKRKIQHDQQGINPIKADLTDQCQPAIPADNVRHKQVLFMNVKNAVFNLQCNSASLI